MFQRNVNFVYPGFRLLGGAWIAKFRQDENGKTSSHEINENMTGNELITKAGGDTQANKISMVSRRGA